jgi:phosphoenolpyruvate-protein phosphotransferase/dihydroxyacetone kinase phosphotransfer subunit
MTVGLVIVSHSAQLAAGVAELAGQMAQGKTAITPAGGGLDDILGTSADKILAAIQAVDGPDGVLVLLDLGSAIMAAEIALELLDSEQQQRVLLSFAPLVEGAVAAAVEASTGHSLAEVKQAAERTANREQLQQLKPLNSLQEEASAATAPAPQPAASADQLEIQLALSNPTGLHARPASLFVQTAARFAARIELSGHGRQTDAASIMGVLSLNLRQGDILTLRASGTEAEAALKALEELVQANFYETPSETEAPTPAPARDITPNQPLPSISQSQAAHEIWRGAPTSSGVAVGPALLYTSGNIALSAVERRSISAEQVTPEQERLRDAVATTAQELQDLAMNLEKTIGPADAAIFEAQALMAQDPELLDVALQAIEEQHIDAASALAAVGEQLASTLAALDNPLLAGRAVDVRDVTSRALRHLSGQTAPKQDLSSLEQPVILVAQDLTPSDTASLRPESVLGICTTHGGPTAHAAILARALGIPAIAGLNENALLVIHTGDELGLDADNGLLYYRPEAQIRTQLEQRQAEQRQRRADLKATAQQGQAPVSIDGRRIHLLANIGSKAEAEAARQWGAEGVGLLRTEFLFATASTLPGEDEQRQRYVQVFQAFRGDTSRQAGPVVVRTLDAGADKPMPALDALLGPPSEANPALGLRGIRIHLAHRALLEQQLSALLQAAAGTGIQLHIMFPMITTVEELRIARAIFDQVYEKLEQRQVALPEHVPVGIMVEVPSAAVMAAELAEIADFFSIGANDLLQYTVASDRTNTSVSHLYNPMEPAVLRLISQVATAGRNAGKPVAVCGEIAGDVRLAPILVALGVDELSMAPNALPAVRAVLLRQSAQDLSTIAEQVLQLKTAAEVEEACKEWGL